MISTTETSYEESSRLKNQGWEKMRSLRDVRMEKAEAKIAAIEKGYKRWGTCSLKERLRTVRRLRKTISKNARRIAEAISSECGRPLSESLSQEVIAVLEMAKYCEKNFSRWISPQKSPYRRPGFGRKKNYLYFEPIGPVAVLSPQNFPFSLGMMTLIYASLAGNTVLLKPSEKSHQVSSIIEELLEESGFLSSGAAAVLKGDGETGEWIIQHRTIKKVFFFGHQGVGKHVAEMCVKHFKSFVLELGGGSTAFVLEDADLEKTASGLVWSSFYADGGACVSTERIFVDKRIAEEFLVLFKEKAAAFQEEMKRNRHKQEVDASKASRLRDLIQDAKDKGAEVFYPGKASSNESERTEIGFTIVSGATSSVSAFRQEIFGPLVAVQSVPDMELAIEEMKKGYQTLAASIWSRSRKRALHLAKKLSTGMVWINDTSVGMPHLPWGGRGNSGWGSLFSEHSIQEVTRLKWVSHHPATFSRKRFWWNPYSRTKEKLLLTIAEKLF